MWSEDHWLVKLEARRPNCDDGATHRQLHTIQTTQLELPRASARIERCRLQAHLSRRERISPALVDAEATIIAKAHPTWSSPTGSRVMPEDIPLAGSDNDLL